MSTQQTNNMPELNGWVSPQNLQAAGYISSGPETDYGHRWGTQQSIRVSFAPDTEAGAGFLYAHDGATGQSLLLASDTTSDAVEQANSLLAEVDIVDGHLALAAILSDHLPLTPEHSRTLWMHCVEREVIARHTYQEIEPSARMAASGAVIINEAARTAAERVMVTAYGAHLETPPVLVRYRVMEWAGWTGRYAAADLDRAADSARALEHAAGLADFTIQATSVSCGASIVAAARVPELSFVAHRAPINLDLGPVL